MLTREHVLTALRTDAPATVLGILILGVGLAALLLYLVHRKPRDPAVLWFALFALLYGTRELLEASTVRFALGLSDRVWGYTAATITYSIVLPSLLFVREVFPMWRRRVTWIIRGQTAFFLQGLVTDIVLGRPYSLITINNVLALAATVLFLVAVSRLETNTDVRALRVGVGVFCASVILNNLAALFGFRFNFNFEAVGFTVFLAALGLVIAHRIIDRQERLVSIEKELEIARRIQQSILPASNPASNRLQVATRYLPMTSVAGDFYDFLLPDPNHIGILVADVSGHGVPAALIASMVKVAIAAQLPHAGNPAQVIAGMNRILCGKLQGQFVSAAYLFLDLDRSTFRYSAAGHPPLLWHHADTLQVESVEENGMVMGLFAHAAYSEVERTFAPGDRFLLYTDGFIEATNGTEEFYGPERLCGSFAAATGLETVVDQLAAWSGRVGAQQEDDLTAVFTEVLPVSN